MHWTMASSSVFRLFDALDYVFCDVHGLAIKMYIFLKQTAPNSADLSPARLKLQDNA
jgi:hypothetical protein